jgi:hypothetical protein
LTKKEEKLLRAEMDSTKRELALERAMRIHEAIAPDVLPPTGSLGLSKGWMFISYGDTLRIEKACSSISSHHCGGWEKTTTQQPRSLYSTRKLALMGLRAEASRRFAGKLADLDRLIAEAEEVVA